MKPAEQKQADRAGMAERISLYMEKKPLVSVIIPTYNRKNTLKRCIDSVLAQTYRNFEIILVDDCSTDGTMEYVEAEYGDVSDINIVYVRNDSNLGAGASRNVGVSYAAGEYLAFHDSDDTWHPDKLEKQMREFAFCNDKVGAVYSLFLADGPDAYVYPPKEVQLPLKSGYVFYTLLLNSLVGMITLVVKKNVFLEAGGFNEQLNSLEDYELTLRIARDYAIILVDEVLATAYESQESVGKRNQDKIITQCYIMDLYCKDLELAGLKKKKFDMVYQDARAWQFEEFFCKCIMQLSPDQDYLAYAQEKWEKMYPSSRPEKIETVDISGVSACTGCMACYNVCPVGAISQGYDDEGFLSPVVDNEKCIRCGRCVDACPVCNETPGMALPNECYATAGSDEIRTRSSSGGVFRVLADQVLAEGGYVAGAVWDEEWRVVHIVSDDPADVDRMMSSKYVQSNAGDVYGQIGTLLEQGKKVLFSGCGCQTAGLRRCLGKDYDNLIVVDVVCHGVASGQVFDACLEKKEEIEEISFRKKEVFGWSVGLYVRYKDGQEYVGDRKEPYVFGFLNNWILRKSCYDCKFKHKIYSDITLGDFWGINKLCDIRDRKGTSYVTLNTARGARFFKKALPQFQKIVSLQREAAENFNPCISQSVEESGCREIFFREWKQRGKRTLSGVMRDVKKQIHFDIAMVCMWGINYGNALTNYALHTFLQNQGKKVVVLDNFCTLTPINQFRKFAQEHYTLSSRYFPVYDYAMLNACCDTFVVASDQNWNYGYSRYYGYGNYFLLDFAADDKKKVSYATSFGTAASAPPGDVGLGLYQRFDAISVREEFGVELCRKEYDVQASWVLDPVFLLKKQDYDRLLAKTPVPEAEPYIAVYFLDPTEEKRQLCLEIQRAMGGMKIINMMDANLRSMDYYMRILEYDNIRTGLDVETWLAYIRHADYVITDSYHGTCFSVIFEKNFVAAKNRESARFDTFKRFEEVSGRIIGKAELSDQTYEAEQFVQPIDYESVNAELAVEIEKSIGFIQENIL